jgi:MFS family permease
VSRCGNIQPVDQDALERRPKPIDPKVIEMLFPTYAEGSRRQLATGLTLGAALLSLVALFVYRYMRKHDMRKHALVEIVLLILGLGAGALLCAFWETIAQYLTENGKGEPIALLGGVSVWPTVLLRVFGIVLSSYFIYLVLRGLNKNLQDIAKKMDLGPEPETIPRQIISISKDVLTLCK